MEKIGTLLDEILNTGTTNRLRSATVRLSKKSQPGRLQALRKAEEGDSPYSLGRGQVLFLYRHVTKSDAARLLASGFRFVRIDAILDLLAGSMEVDKDSLRECLKRMQDHPGTEEEMESGLHLALFALKPLHLRGFEVLVNGKARHLLPSTRIQGQQIEQWQRNLLESLDGCTVPTVREKLQCQADYLNADGRSFLGRLAESLSELGDQVGSSVFNESRLVFDLFHAPIYGRTLSVGRSQFIALRLILSAHERVPLNGRLALTPLGLFLSRQRILGSDEDIVSFARVLRDEFGLDLNQRLTHETATSVSRLVQKPAESASPHGRMSIHRQTKTWSSRIWHGTSQNISDDSASDRSEGAVFGNVENVDDDGTRQSQEPTTLTEGGADKSGAEAKAVEVHYEPAQYEQQQATFADRLLALTLAERRR